MSSTHSPHLLFSPKKVQERLASWMRTAVGIIPEAMFRLIYIMQ